MKEESKEERQPPKRMQVVIRESLDQRDRTVDAAPILRPKRPKRPPPPPDKLFDEVHVPKRRRKPPPPPPDKLFDEVHKPKRRRPPPPPPDKLFNEVHSPTRRRDQRKDGRRRRPPPPPDKLFDELSAPKVQTDPEFPVFPNFPQLSLLPPEANAPRPHFIDDASERRRHREKKLSDQKLWRAKRRRKAQDQRQKPNHKHNHHHPSDHHHDHHHEKMPDTIRRLLPSSARVVGVARPHPQRLHQLDQHVMSLDDFLHRFPPETHPDHSLVAVEVGGRHANMIKDMAAAGGVHHQHHHQHPHPHENSVFTELEELVRGRAPRRIPGRRNRPKQRKKLLAKPRGQLF